jgi:mycofactocin precursor
MIMSEVIVNESVNETNQEPVVLEEIVVEQIGIDGICGVY